MAPLMPYAFALFVTLQSLGLLVALLSRMAIGTSAQGICHGLFFLVLLLVGATTLVSLWAGSILWLVSGLNLGLMVVAAVHDPRGSVVRTVRVG